MLRLKRWQILFCLISFANSFGSFYRSMELSSQLIWSNFWMRIVKVSILLTILSGFQLGLEMYFSIIFDNLSILTFRKLQKKTLAFHRVILSQNVLKYWQSRRKTAHQSSCLDNISTVSSSQNWWATTLWGIVWTWMKTFSAKSIQIKQLCILVLIKWSPPSSRSITQRLAAKFNVLHNSFPKKQNEKGIHSIQQWDQLIRMWYKRWVNTQKLSQLSKMTHRNTFLQ
jgi:hypothetical protein